METPELEMPDFRLRIDAHALVQLGEQLITDDEQALLELVKNSYDADADWAKIRVISDYIPTREKDFVPPEAVGLIEIEDNGIGMDQKAVELGWLLISLSPKRLQKALGERTKKHGRLPLGDKGLGRLGAQKLGYNIELFTKPKNEDFEYQRGYFSATRGEEQSAMLLMPELRFYPSRQSETTEASIHSGLFANFYMNMGEQSGSTWPVHFFYHPMVVWIWIGALLMAVGGALSWSTGRLLALLRTPFAARTRAVAAE